MNESIGEDVESAISSAWERMERAIELSSNSRIEVARLMGFLEGRLSVSIPMAWEQEIQLTYIGSPVPDDFELPELPFDLASSELDVFVTKGISVEFAFDEQWQIRGSQLAIPLIDFDGRDLVIGERSIDCLYMAATALDDTTAVIGFCKSAPRAFPILRLDSTGSIIWESEVSCMEQEDFESRRFVGPLCLNVEFAHNESTLFVFGKTNGVVFIEGFDLNNGENLFRFSSFKHED